MKQRCAHRATTLPGVAIVKGLAKSLFSAPLGKEYSWNNRSTRQTHLDDRRERQSPLTFVLSAHVLFSPKPCLKRLLVAPGHGTLVQGGVLRLDMQPITIGLNPAALLIARVFLPSRCKSPLGSSVSIALGKKG